MLTLTAKKGLYILILSLMSAFTCIGLIVISLKERRENKSVLATLELASDIFIMFVLEYCLLTNLNKWAQTSGLNFVAVAILVIGLSFMIASFIVQTFVREKLEGEGISSERTAFFIITQFTLLLFMVIIII